MLYSIEEVNFEIKQRLVGLLLYTRRVKKNAFGDFASSKHQELRYPSI